ncbi:cell division protein ZipA [Moraxella bovis]|uniref:Cell division protein ZipA n=1 Tax=Moraxella bovis TaxID=476 RepID=A0AAX3ETI4_MORBO|nr:cell division protein ZipA C-terminal FtsZ-binding domain-containing protein [Moraxella bovis]UYZ81828.1 cell division protein ZipA [Moraxella bovis]UYZ96022.1 cell division protein ZipA [Moraxella bovis]UZA06869.1 cell division protein ZipA [Moraxella bovis]UZA10903.1 cell division protein ZipA [Moraxella bovis]UZA23731.1 cell division protein ZipA [Moraxella bovis]
MSTFLTIVVVLVILLGLWLIIRSMLAKDFEGDTKTLAYKDGLPILPRDERGQSALSVETQSQDETVSAEPVKSGRELADETKADALSSLAMVASQDSNTHNTPQDDDADILADEPIKKERFTEPSSDFVQNSPVLDRHLEEQQAFDQDNDPLLNAQETVTVVITPKDQYNGLSGRAVLDIVRAYGLKYGVMNMYHRYEREDGTGKLWFSMLGVGYDGSVEGFDLNTLTDSHFSALSLFLSLPHPHALRGFDSMVSVAQMIAKDINADVHDDEGYILDGAYLAKLRAKVADYR